MFVMLCYDVVDLPDVLLMAGEYLDLFDSESDISGDVSDELVEFFWLDTCLEAEKGCTAPSLCLPENQRCLCVRKCSTPCSQLRALDIVTPCAYMWSVVFE